MQTSTCKPRDKRVPQRVSSIVLLNSVTFRDIVLYELIDNRWNHQKDNYEIAVSIANKLINYLGSL
jgi:hypothetical protein